ncbi:MAG: MFS transporter [Desulfofustis sp. PB-SRB1]|jgi:EmrB/QacA subfamily drug resistance transporter|nr:MFS transporter [Desulfofustis sp. PB-SRB1]MBM1000980.1 MFS transporter [Desulfofustis sp. PB-SRB1]HBH30223.1 MFS transporter [Desulfofustis sp.]
MSAPSATTTSLERSALIVAVLTSFMGPFMISSVNVALPTIQADFDLGAVQLSWISTAYLLAVAVGLVPAGKVADIYGRKIVFVAGLFLYTIAVGGAAIATSGGWLIGARVGQGLGAAMFVTTGMAIITSVFPPNRRGRVIGIYVAAVYIGLSAGPFFGGIITQQFGWRALFYLVFPFGVFLILLTLGYLKGEWRGEPGQRLDVAGCVLYGTALCCLVYGATRLPSIIGALLGGGGVILLIVFVRHQLRASYPVFEVRLFAANKTFAFSSLAALLNYSATFAVTFLLSLYLQYIKGMSPQSAGSILMAQPVMMALLSPVAGRLSDRIEPRLLATAGMSVTVVGVMFFIMIDTATPVGLIVANLIILGTGFALFSSPNMSAIMGAVEQRLYGVASGAVATMRLLGQMASMAIATVVLSLLIGSRAITPPLYDRFLDSLHLVFAISALLCSAGIYFSWFRGSLFDPENGKSEGEF